jgi:hypothetical protein
MTTQLPSNKKRELSFSAIFLFVSNLVTIALFNIQHWDFFTIIWVFCFQFLAIGLFNVILVLKSKGDIGTKFFVGYFLIGFYSVFLFILITALWNKPPEIDTFNWILIIGAFLLFFINHFRSFLGHRRQIVDLGDVLRKHIFLRIGPIWFLLIIAGGIDKAVASSDMVFLNGFLLLKTAVDVVTHVLENINEPKYEKQDLGVKKEEVKAKNSLVGIILFVTTFWIWIIGGIISLNYSVVCIPTVILGVVFLLVSIIYNFKKKTIVIKKTK